MRVALCSALLCSSAFYVCSAVYKGGAGAGCMGVCACVLLLRCPAFCWAMSLLHFAVVAWLRLCAICYIKSRKSGKFIVKFVQFNGINMHTMLNCSTPKTKIFLDFLGLLWYNLTVRRKKKRTRWQQIRKKHKKSECFSVPKVSTHQQNPRQVAQRATRIALPPDRSHCNTVR